MTMTNYRQQIRERLEDIVDDCIVAAQAGKLTLRTSTDAAMAVIEPVFTASMEMRDACAALLRVISRSPDKVNLVKAIGLELQRSGVADGFGARFDHALARAAGLENKP